MKYIIPSKSVGDFTLPVLGLGTYMMGGRFMRNPFNDDKGDIAAIRAAMEMGMTHIDTAEIYANGHAERLIAKAISGISREQFFITSKVSWNHLKYDEVLEAAKGSLARLGLKQLDLSLVHAPNKAVPLKETMRAMERLIDEGMTRFIGVSNFDKNLLQEAQSCCKYKIVNNQIHYSILARTYAENGTLDYCCQNQILVTAYRPLEKGALLNQQYALLMEMARKYSATSAQIAIKWLSEEPNVVALVKSSSPDHLRENIESLKLEIEATDLRKLSQEMPRIAAINVN